MSICEYNGCNKTIDLSHDDKLCHFHAPIDKKGISGEEFNERIFNQIYENDFIFEGYIFPAGIKFDNIEFNKGVYFGNTIFLGAFKDTDQVEYCATFRKVKFKSNVYFTGAKFSGGVISFLGAEFFGKNIYFLKTEFSGGSAYFTDAKFNKGNVNFIGAKFIKGKVYFNGAEFAGGNVIFIGTEFTGAEANFRKTIFSYNLTFEQNKM